MVYRAEVAGNMTFPDSKQEPATVRFKPKKDQSCVFIGKLSVPLIYIPHQPFTRVPIYLYCAGVGHARVGRAWKALHWLAAGASGGVLMCLCLQLL